MYYFQFIRFLVISSNFKYIYKETFIFCTNLKFILFYFLRKLIVKNTNYTMGVDNFSLGASLNSKDETKLLYALLTLYGQCISSRSITNYIPMIIEILCKKDTSTTKVYQGKNPVLIHIIINILKSCLDFISEKQKHKIMQFVATEFLYTGNFWLLRDITELCFNDFQLYEKYFLEENPLIPVITGKLNKNWSIVDLLLYGGIQKSENLRQRLSNSNGVVNVSIPQAFEFLETEQTIILLNFLNQIIQFSFQESEKSEKNYDTLYEDFYLLLLDKISDSNQTISSAAFQILHDLICKNSNYHPYFHGQVLPIQLTKNNIMWIKKFFHHFHMLVTRMKCLGVEKAYVGFRPLTYIALYLQQEIDQLEGSQMHNENKQSISSEHTIETSALNQLLLPLLSTVDPTTVMEAAHCILLLSFDPELMSSEFSSSTSREVDQAVLALVNLLNRDLPHVTRVHLYKDICSLINCVRDKFYICCKIIDHFAHIKNDETRMYILTCIFRTLIQLSVNSRLKNLFDIKSGNIRNNNKGGPSKYQATELSMFFKEPFLKYIWRANLSMQFEQKLRIEILFCVCQEFLNLSKLIQFNSEEKSNNSDNDQLQLISWISVGLDIIEQTRDCLTWDNHSKNIDLSRFFQLLTFICSKVEENLRQSEEEKRSQLALRSLLDDWEQCKNDFGQLVSLSVIVNFIHVHKPSTSGREISDVVFQYLTQILKQACSETLNKQSKSKPIYIDTLFQSLLFLCYKSPLKLQESNSFLSDLLNKTNQMFIIEKIKQTLARIRYANEKGILRNQEKNASSLEMIFGKCLDNNNHIFKSFNTKDDDRLLLDNIKAFQTIIDTSANIHDSDPFYVASSCGTQIIQKTGNRVFKKPSIVQVAYKAEHVKEIRNSQIISLPSDPILVNASYTFSFRNATLELYIKLYNPTNMILHDVCVEIGVNGAFQPSGDSVTSTKLVGKMNPKSTFSVSQVFVLSQFSRCSVNIVVLASPSEKPKEISFFVSKNIGRSQLRMRCTPIEVHVSNMLKRPLLMSHNDFLTLWETFQSSFHVQLLISNVSPLDIIYNIMNKTPFLQVETSNNQLRNEMYQLCYVSRTLFGDFVLLVIICQRDYSGNYICDLEFRASTPSTLHTFEVDEGKWIEKEWLSISNDNPMLESQNSEIKLIPKDSFSKTHYYAFNNSSTNYNFINVENAFNIDKLQQQAFYIKKWQKIKERSISTSKEY